MCLSPSLALRYLSLSLSSSDWTGHRVRGGKGDSLSPLYRGVPPGTETWAEMRGLWRPGGSPRTMGLSDEKGRGLLYQNKESFLATGPAASELKHLHQHFPYLRGPEWGHQSHHELASPTSVFWAQKRAQGYIPLSHPLLGSTGCQPSFPTGSLLSLLQARLGSSLHSQSPSGIV